MTHSERMKELWRDLVARDKMLAGGKKANEARRNTSERARAEHRYRCHRAQAARIQQTVYAVTRKRAGWPEGNNGQWVLTCFTHPATS